MLDLGKYLPLAIPALVGAFAALLVAPVTEAIKLSLMRKSWARQEMWKLKVSLYERLLIPLAKLENLMEPRYESNPPYYPDLNESGTKSFYQYLGDIEAAEAVAAMWLPDAATKALAGLRGTVDYADPSEWREQVYESACKTREVVLAIIKENLNTL